MTQGIVGWYVGPTINYYQCVNFFLLATRTTRDTDTVTFTPKHVKFPAANSTYFLHQTAINIISLITKPLSSTTTSLEAGDTTRNGLLQVSDSLQNYTVTPPAPDPPVQTPHPVQLTRTELTT